MARELFRRGLLDRSRALIAWCVGVALYILFLAAAFPVARGISRPGSSSSRSIRKG